MLLRQVSLLHLLNLLLSEVWRTALYTMMVGLDAETYQHTCKLQSHGEQQLEFSL